MLDIPEDELLLLLVEAVDRGPGLWCTSPQLYKSRASHATNTTKEKYITRLEIKSVFACIVFPGINRLQFPWSYS